MGLTDTQFRLVKSRAKARFRELGLMALKRPPKRSAKVSIPTKTAVVGIDHIVPIVAHAVGVFGDEQKASHWLSTPLVILGDLSPAQVLAREGGTETIDRILTRIEHNIPS